MHLRHFFENWYGKADFLIFLELLYFKMKTMFQVNEYFYNAHSGMQQKGIHLQIILTVTMCR